VDVIQENGAVLFNRSFGRDQAIGHFYLGSVPEHPIEVNGKKTHGLAEQWFNLSNSHDINGQLID